MRVYSGSSCSCTTFYNVNKTFSSMWNLSSHSYIKRIPEKYLLLLYWLCQSLWLCRSHKQWKILQEMGIPDHLTCLLRNLHAGQEARVRTGHGTTDWFQIGKRVRQGCILSLCLFNLYAEYIMRNAGLDEAQAGIKIAGRNINNLRYANDTIFMVESEKELKSLLMKVKEESEKPGKNSTFKKTKILASGFPVANRWGNNGKCGRLYFWGSKIIADGDCSHEIKRHFFLGRKAKINLDGILKKAETSLCWQRSI